MSYVQWLAVVCLVVLVPFWIWDELTVRRNLRRARRQARHRK